MSKIDLDKGKPSVDYTFLMGMEYSVCQYCTIGRNAMCDEAHDEYTCTREKGHGGPHVACGLYKHAVKAWENSGGEA